MVLGLIVFYLVLLSFDDLLLGLCTRRGSPRWERTSSHASHPSLCPGSRCWGSRAESPANQSNESKLHRRRVRVTLAEGKSLNNKGTTQLRSRTSLSKILSLPYWKVKKGQWNYWTGQRPNRKRNFPASLGQDWKRMFNNQSTRWRLHKSK